MLCVAHYKKPWLSMKARSSTNYMSVHKHIVLFGRYVFGISSKELSLYYFTLGLFGVKMFKMQLCQNISRDPAAY